MQTFGICSLQIRGFAIPTPQTAKVGLGLALQGRTSVSARGSDRNHVFQEEQATFGVFWA